MQEQDDDLIDIIRMIRQQEGEGAEGQGQERLNEKIEVLGSELELSVLRNAVQAQVVERLGEDWDYFYGLLLAWKKTSDEEFPRIDEVFRRAELGRWVDRQRSAYKKGLLARGRVEKLESIPGWTWDFTDWLWDRGWRELKSFVEHNSHSLVPDRYVTNNGYKLGAFVKSKRRQYDEGRLPQARALSLEALPRWSWQPNIDQWEIEYEKVRGKAKNSDLLVALEQSGSVHRVWLMTQKSRYSAMTGRSTARHKSLTKDQIKKLEALPGWSWNRRRDSWLAHFVALVAYKDANKGELPPSTNKTLEFRGLRIVSWMIKQRSRVDVREEWQLKMLRKKLPELLESPFEKRWNLAFGKLKEFVRDTGAPYIPQKIRWKGFALGGWVSNQRTKYREKKLTIEQVRLLQSIKGWTWDASALSASGLSKQGVSPLKRARKLR
jgi:hypothetical protein